jgi:transcriptional regulator with PAS, ATPase and Fis domain
MNISDLLAQYNSSNPTKPPLNPQQVIDRLPESLQNRIRDTPLGQRMRAYRSLHEPTLAMLRLANIVAQRDEPVLIMGETGTGKELLAKIMLNQRGDSAFFAQNCAGIPDLLFESLMFGHKAGSFTGAARDNLGFLVSAGAGIAFLDEIGELPLNQQAKLLRAIQDRKVLPVGSPYVVPIQCRFVFATNRNLHDMVKSGTFREDLFYRISALSFQTYPLRDRPDDAILIAKSLCESQGWEMPISIPDNIINDTGNVRALENWLLQRHVYGIGRDDINPAIGENI